MTSIGGQGEGVSGSASQWDLERLEALACLFERAGQGSAEGFERFPSIHEKDWQRWARFCRRRGLPEMPADPDHIRRYLLALVGAEAKAGRTLRETRAKRHLSAIATRHRFCGYRFDTEHPLIEDAMAGIRRATFPRGSAEPLELDHVRLMAAAAPHDVGGARDRALILLGYATCWFLKDLVQVNSDDILFFPEGMCIFRPTSPGSNEGHLYPVTWSTSALLCPVRAVAAWMRLALLEEDPGPLFCSCRSNGSPSKSRLSPREVNRIVQKACKRIGLKRGFCGPSLRKNRVRLSFAGDPAVVRAWLKSGRFGDGKYAISVWDV